MNEPKYIGGPFRIGEVINGQYKVIRLLGAGGHAFVYECHDDVLDAVVALKVITATMGRGQELLKRAKAEAAVMFRLRHPNVVQVHCGFIVDNSMVCIAMEKLEGLTLRMLLALLGRLTIVEALQIARQIALGVGAAHELNVIHRDVKPDNIFVLPPDNAVKVLDFGIAKFMGHGLQTTNKDRLHGTPIYMSPEHLRTGRVTIRSDIYQLGTVLFELIAGVNPCLLDQEIHDVGQVGMLQISRVAPPISTLARGASAGLDWLIQCAIAKDPNQRFAFMKDMVQAIDRALEERLANQPQEGKNIRYVDETMIRAAKELAARADPEDLIGRMPPGNDARQEDPIELAPTKQVAAPTNTVPAQPVFEQPIVTTDNAAAPIAEPPRPLGRPVLAPTVEIGARRRGRNDVTIRRIPPAVSAQQPASVAAVPQPASVASHQQSAPMQSARQSALVVAVPRPASVGTAQQAESLAAAPQPASVAAVAQPASVAPQPVALAEPVVAQHQPPVSEINPTASLDQEPLASDQPATTTAVSVSQPEIVLRKRRPMSATLLITPIMLGAIVGTGISLKWKQHDREAVAARQVESRSQSIPAAMPVAPPSPQLDVPAAVPVAPPSPQLDVPTVASADTTPTTTSSTGLDTVASAPPLATHAVVAKSAQPKPATTKKTPSLWAPEGAFKPEPPQKATKEELERARARVREFNEDIDRELKATGKVKP